MVNNSKRIRLILSHECSIVVNKNGRSIITNGPVYCLETAKELLPTHQIRVVNDQADIDKAQRFFPELEDEELIPFIKALTPDDRQSSERCQTTNRRVLDCDGYAMPWNRAKSERWDQGSWIYLKFGYIDNITRTLVVSVHPSIVPRKK